MATSISMPVTPQAVEHNSFLQNFHLTLMKVAFNEWNITAHDLSDPLQLFV
jgi:hypothetical protein